MCTRLPSERMESTVLAGIHFIPSHTCRLKVHQQKSENQRAHEHSEQFVMTYRCYSSTLSERGIVRIQTVFSSICVTLTFPSGFVDFIHASVLAMWAHEMNSYGMMMVMHRSMLS